MGNWTKDNMTLGAGEVPGKFQINLLPVPDDRNMSHTYYQSIVWFKNSSSVKGFPHTRHRFIGFSDDINSSFVLFHFEKQENPVNGSFVANISSLLLNYNDFIEDLPEIRTDVQDLAGNFSVTGEIYFLAFRIGDGDFIDEPFRLSTTVNGTAITDSFNLNITGFEFDLPEFIREGKRCGVIAAFCMVLTFYAWLSISRVRTVTGLTQLSMYSLMMHTAFEFNYGLFLLNIGMMYSFFVLLFLILFTCSICIYFTFQMQVLSNVWKTTFNVGDLQMPEIRRLFVRLFAEMTGLMLLSLFAMKIMEYPFIPLLYLHSAFIPQIVLNVQRGEKKDGDSIFTVLITLHRIIQLVYYYIYRNNVTGSYSPGVAGFFIVYDVLQMVLILVQNKRGGAFFLPRRYRRVGFNYFDNNVNPEEECSICMGEIGTEPAMVTPCAHTFHRECLQRWMQEQMICPFCRAPLPPIVEEDDLYN